jgi:ketosteroid isomerase-like protein
MKTPLSNQALADRMRDVWTSFERDGERVLAQLGELYAANVVFHDPLQTLRGRDAFLAMNRRILRRARRLSFEVPEAVGSKDGVFLVWTMTFEPRRGRRIVFEGASYARVQSGLVVEQRDYWDLLSSVAASFPLLGRIYGALTPHLG